MYLCKQYDFPRFSLVQRTREVFEFYREERFMEYTKRPLTIEEQIERLEQRGLKFSEKITKVLKRNKLQKHLALIKKIFFQIGYMLFLIYETAVLIIVVFGTGVLW